MLVFTTAEVVIGECQSATFLRFLVFLFSFKSIIVFSFSSKQYFLFLSIIVFMFSSKKCPKIFSREYDPATGFDELKVEARK